MNRSLLVIGHGSRSQDASDIFHKVVNLMKNSNEYQYILGAHMELAKPDVPEVVEELNKLQVKEIVVVPYFLYEGIHFKEDIPEIIENMSAQYPHITFKLAKPIGYEPALADILLKRAGDVSI